MKNIHLFSLFLTFVLVVGLFSFACASKPTPTSAPSTSPAPAPKPSPSSTTSTISTTALSPTATAKPTTTTTPAQTSKVYKWTVQTQYPSSSRHHIEYAEAFARIKIASGGRLDATVHTTNEVVPYYQEFKAVKEGTIDVAGIAGFQFNGIIGPKSNLIGGSGFPGGPTAEEYMAHFYQGNGQKLAQELYGDSGEVIGTQAIAPEFFCHSKKPLSTAADFKGLKFRTAGIWGDVLNKYYGTSVVNLAGGEVYSSAEKGVIDAFEYGTAAVNWPMGFHQIMKYIGVPGIHSPAGLVFCIVNKQKWAELPDDLKEIVKSEVMSGGYNGLQWQHYQDALAIQKYKDYGTIFFTVSDEFQKDIVAKSKEFHMQYYNQDPMFKKVWDDMAAFGKAYSEWAQVTPSLSVFN